ncbi:MAG: sulfurtransferase TusA family protein [Pseudomonadota bacterium]
MTDQAESVTVLDVRGLICPLPVLKAKKAMRGLKSGSRLRVEATDPLAVVDIPHFCQEDGHILLEQGEADGVHVFLIERGTWPATQGS